jgi:four helix bundle protein
MQNKIYDIKKRTYLYALAIIRFLESLPKDYISQTLGRQLLRSATSVGANVIEAQGSGSRRDFTNFYSYALKSANESKFWLNLLRDSGKISFERIHTLISEANELSNIIASSIISLRGKRYTF